MCFLLVPFRASCCPTVVTCGRRIFDSFLRFVIIIFFFVRIPLEAGTNEDIKGVTFKVPSAVSSVPTDKECRYFWYVSDPLSGTG